MNPFMSVSTNLRGKVDCWLRSQPALPGNWSSICCTLKLSFQSEPCLGPIISRLLIEFVETRTILLATMVNARRRVCRSFVSPLGTLIPNDVTIAREFNQISSLSLRFPSGSRSACHTCVLNARSLTLARTRLKVTFAN